MTPPRDLADAQQRLDDLTNDLECLRLDYDHLARNYRQLRSDLNSYVGVFKGLADSTPIGHPKKKMLKDFADLLVFALERPLE